MKANLWLSLPGTSKISAYCESPHGKQTFCFAPFGKGEKVRVRMSKATETVPFTLVYRETVPHVASRAEHLDLVKEAIGYIKEKGLGKIVLARTRYINRKVAPFRLFEVLAESYPQAAVYLFSHPDCGTWLGASPETLLKREGNRLRTMSLAGTQKIGEEHNFTAKEREEQELVTRYIEQTLKRHNGVKDVKTHPTQLSPAANLVHFKNEIEAGVMAGFEESSLLRDLHPTPAVAGFPKKEALAFISDREPFARHFYAGYFGLKTGTDFQYFVNLRCMQVFEEGCSLYAGGGITKRSDPEAEWMETEAKMQTLQSVWERLD